jgi:phosphatidylcholine synthase
MSKHTKILPIHIYLRTPTISFTSLGALPQGGIAVFNYWLPEIANKHVALRLYARSCCKHCIKTRPQVSKLPKKRDPIHVMAYGVHVFTALGAALGFLALKAALEGNIPLCFWWLSAALFVDAADGPMARKLNVQETASRYDGATLDLVVDFITYVFVPAAILLRSDVIAAPWGLASGLLITIGSALYFADTTMKTEDWWFRGFPAVWNVVIFYIVIFSPHPILAFGIVAVLTAMMFLPVVFVHPVRVTRWRVLTLSILVVWCAASASALWQNLRPDMITKAIMLGGAVYFLGLGFLRELPPETDPA